MKFEWKKQGFCFQFRDSILWLDINNLITLDFIHQVLLLNSYIKC